jgi:nitrogen fixation protein NifU and related proteins
LGFRAVAPYSAKVMSHFHAPRNAGRMEDADIIGRGSLNGRSPCTEIYLKITGSTVRRASFTTFGCGVSIACASVVTEMLAGRRRAECAEITESQIIDALDGIPSEKQFCAGIVVLAVRDAIAQWAEREHSGIQPR